MGAGHDSVKMHQAVSLIFKHFFLYVVNLHFIKKVYIGGKKSNTIALGILESPENNVSGVIAGNTSQNLFSPPLCSVSQYISLYYVFNPPQYSNH